MRASEIEEWAPDLMPYAQPYCDQDNADKSHDAKVHLCHSRDSWKVEMNQAMMTTAPGIIGLGLTKISC